MFGKETDIIRNVKLLFYPDARLREVARPIGSIGKEHREIARAMLEIMYRARGIGLAGPQVGYGFRIVVANLTGDSNRKEEEKVFINPRIRSMAGEMREEEGCLSLPGIVLAVPRAAKVVVDALDLDGDSRQIEAEGLAAKLFQHEIDHLDGVLLVDKMTPADRRQWAAVLKEFEGEYRKARKGRKPREQGVAAL